MASTTSVNKLKINVMPQNVHTNFVNNNKINENELYLVADGTTVLSIEEGGTGVAANDIAELRTALGVAPVDHTSTEPSCGTGNDVKFGHVKLSDSVDSTSGVGDGIAATPAAVKAAYDLAKNKPDLETIDNTYVSKEELKEITLIEVQPKITAEGILKSDGNGNVTPAVAGVDYVTPDNVPSGENATSTTAGVMKLYEETGTNTDGTMTQKIITENLENKADIYLNNVDLAGYNEWVVSENLPNSNSNWQSVCYGDDKYVAVAYDSNIAAYSTDGITWIESTLPSSAYWRSVCYGNGKYVAVVLNSNKAAYSTDGITWTESTLPSSATWQSVCYGDGKFVAVAGYLIGTNKVAYSTDGITWTSSTLPSSAYWQSVCYGNGKYVAVVYNSNKAAYSTDGITWTASTLPSSDTWRSVCYGDGKFVAVVHGSNKAAYSTDGINWTASTLPSNVNWQSVCYGNDKFVAVAYNSNTAAYSTGGITWTVSTLPLNNDTTKLSYWYSVCYCSCSR